jgi:two-component system chemotaxis sensor kinase CheA
VSDEHLLSEARGVFMEESREMLTQFEQSLLDLENDPGNAETLNAAFRAAHTIKGSSGLFGYKAVVAFMHEVEAVLDAMRVGTLSLDADASALLLRCCDQITTMLDQLGAGAEDATPADPALFRELGALRGRTAGAAPAADATAEAEADAEPGEPGEGIWHLSVRFKPDALRDGFDPLSFIRYLARLGQVVDIFALDYAVPALEEIDPEGCYLGFEIRLRTSADRAAIAAVFEFAQEDCELTLLAPGVRVEEYLKLLGPVEAIGDDVPPLGEALVAVGALTRDELRGLLARQSAIAAEEGKAPALGELAIAELATPPAVVKAAVDKQERAREQKREDARSIRVPADKLDRLINLIGELVIASSGAQMVAQQDGSTRFGEAAQRIAHLVEEARNGALQLRMVQIGETFARFQRVVRDTAKALGKEIRLEIHGGDTELDKSMVEQIADPLMHLVRNSIDHGIEPGEERVARGKGAGGTLQLNAFHDSGSIIIEVTDDGRGLDRDRILAKAIERGLVKDGAGMSDQDIWQLIFAPGFSTAAKVTDISGRGVGMDVVRRNIQALRGTVTLDTRPGQGTTTRIRLPLTLAIIDGFLVGVGKGDYIVPLETVVECIERPDHTAIDRAGTAGYLDLRGEVLPYLDLHRVFADGSEPAASRRSIVVVRTGARKVGLLVDRLHGEYQTVIKPLGRLLGGVRGIAGSTILGTGGVALILDVPALVDRTMRAGTLSQAAHTRNAIAAQA